MAEFTLPVFDSNRELIAKLTVTVDDSFQANYKNVNWKLQYMDGLWRVCASGIISQLKYLHTLVWEYSGQSVPEGYVIDHINRDTLDNRLENLRILSSSENRMNTRPVMNKTYKGIRKHGDKWQARIVDPNGDRLSLGYYDSEEDAARAYDAKAYKLYPGIAYLNFPDEVENG